MDIINRIVLAKSNFLKKFSVVPDTVYLGENDFFELKSSVNHLNLFQCNNTEQKIMDMTLIVVRCENHISVGHNQQ